MGHPFIDRARRINILRRLLIPCLLCVGMVGRPSAAQAATAAGPAPYVVTRSANSGGFDLVFAINDANARLDAQIAQVGAQCINRRTSYQPYNTPYGYVYAVTASADCTQ